MVKQGTIIYSVNKYGEATPYIVWCVEDDYAYCNSIQPARWNAENRMCIATDKIFSNCFNEDDASEADFGNVFIPNDEKKINRYCKKRFNEK